MCYDINRERAQVIVRRVELLVSSKVLRIC
jgi:hypothetical protein